MRPPRKYTPTLRFPEFKGDWQVDTLEQVFALASGTTPLRANLQYFQEAKHNWVKTTDLNNGEIVETEERVSDLALEETSLKKYPCGTVLIALYGGFNQIGRTGLLKVEAAINQALVALPPNFERIEPYFLLYFLNRNVLSWRRLAASSRKDPNLTQNDIAKFHFIYPPLEEQKKIAAFLSAVDEKIAHLIRKKQLLLRYKKGLMQQIFGQKIRFKDDSGNDFPDWEEKRLRQISLVVKRTLPATDGIPVMTISGRRGFLRQEDRFSKVIAGESLENYIALKKGELAYNRGNSKSAMYGSINLMMSNIALVPFVYHCFKLKNGIDPQFIEYFSLTDYVNRQLRRVITSTARMNGLLNISKSDFFETKFKIPCNQEQKKIVGVLALLDRNVEAVDQQLEKTRTFKKGLLQQMFV